MKLALFFFTAILFNTFAALPPQYQNSNDLEVMVDWLHLPENEMVLSDLKSITLEPSYSIFYFNPNHGEDCQILFKRKEVNHPRGWVGPASKLEFYKNTCE
jgi:hypothetical protein